MKTAALIAAQHRGLSFADAVDRYLAAKLDAFRNAKHRQQWRNTLDSYALPDLGPMLVQDIGTQDVLRVPAAALQGQSVQVWNPATGTIETRRVEVGLNDKVWAEIRSRLSPRHVPDAILAAPAVPHTRTGKKLELPVKRLLQGRARDEEEQRLVQQRVHLGGIPDQVGHGAF